MSYSGDPSSSDKDKVRFVTGDTVEPFILSDAEIEYLLENSETVNDAIIAAIKIMLPRVAKCVDEKVGNVSVAYSKWYENLKDAYDDLTSDLNTVVGIYVGGMTCSGVATAKNAGTAGSLFVQPRSCCETYED